MKKNMKFKKAGRETSDVELSKFIRWLEVVRELDADLGDWDELTLRNCFCMGMGHTLCNQIIVRSGILV